MSHSAAYILQYNIHNDISVDSFSILSNYYSIPFTNETYNEKKQ